LDLYLIHWPHAFAAGDVKIPKREDGSVIYDEDADYVDTWAAMEELVGAGLVRSIGVSNFNASQVSRVLAVCKLRPAMNQVESHPYFDQRRLLEFCGKEGIPLTAYCPLGSGDNPFRTDSDPVLLNDETLQAIGAKYGKSAAQVAIRWQMQRGVVVIPKSVSPARIAQNFDVMNFELSSEDMQAIGALNRDWRCNVPAVFVDGKPVPRDAKHRHYPFNDELN
jgi:diketogulonate reductase-like aldo/keto reductase